MLKFFSKSINMNAIKFKNEICFHSRRNIKKRFEADELEIIINKNYEKGNIILKLLGKLFFQVYKYSSGNLTF